MKKHARCQLGEGAFRIAAPGGSIIVREIAESTTTSSELAGSNVGIATFCDSLACLGDYLVRARLYSLSTLLQMGQGSILLRQRLSVIAHSEQPVGR
jgi:hypothetical protein